MSTASPAARRAGWSGAPVRRGPLAARARARMPLVVLVASLLLTGVAAFLADRLERARADAAFDVAVRATQERIERRMRLYASILEGANALFSASGVVTREEFRTFVEHFEVATQFPGIRGIGFARRLVPGEVAALEAGMRAQGREDFRVRPPPDGRAELSAIQFLEPLDALNRAAIGFDMTSEPVRRAAMEAARDLGTPVLSARVTLVQEIDPDEVQPGFLLYDAVYEGAARPQTLDERRSRLVGWVYSPFRAHDLFRGIFADVPGAGVAFRIYDGTRVDDARLLYDSALHGQPLPDGAPRRVQALHVFGRDWRVLYAARPTLVDGRGRLLAPSILLAGAIVSVLLWALARAESRARRRAERSEATRSRFYASMSHELRTPLNAIIGYNDLLLTGVYGELAPSQERGIARSQKAARHLLDVVNDVLDFSKIEAGKLEIEDEDVPIVPLVQDLFTTLHRMAEEAGVELVLRCDDARRRVRTDPRRVRQIVLNLLSNAIKFGAPGRVEVECATPPGGGVRIAVRDQGPGIAAVDQERIFEEFVQLPNLVRGGTGLGLPISRRLATILGGSLEVTSAPGEGATFVLELPAVRPGASAPAR